MTIGRLLKLKTLFKQGYEHGRNTNISGRCNKVSEFANIKHKENVNFLMQNRGFHGNKGSK